MNSENILSYIQSVEGEKDNRIRYNQGYWDGYSAALIDIKNFINDMTKESEDDTQ